MSKRKKRILIISRTPWNEENSFGNSYSNIFGDIDCFEYANLYCDIGTPKNNIVHKYFSIDEKKLVKNLINKNHKSGEAFELNCEKNLTSTFEKPTSKQIKIVNFFKKNRNLLFFWIRDLIWLTGRWKSKELKKFIDDFKPDLIFSPIYYWPYMNRIGLFVKKYSKKNMLGYISDDNYTLKQFSLNPFFWLDRLWKRRIVKMAVDECEILYVISDIQKKDYDICFKKDCKILYKGGKFDVKPKIKPISKREIVFLYSGNIGDSRYKNLALLGKAIDNHKNKNGIKIIFKIYTATPLTSKMKKSFDSLKNTILCNPVSSKEIKKIQQESDVLIHTEPFNLKKRLLVRHSFSTKVVDYFQASRCIFAIGHQDIASIKYLKDNNAAIIATNQKDIENRLKVIIKDPQLISRYADNAWDCGKKNHNLKEIQKCLTIDILKLFIKTN